MNDDDFFGQRDFSNITIDLESQGNQIIIEPVQNELEENQEKLEYLNITNEPFENFLKNFHVNKSSLHDKLIKENQMLQNKLKDLKRDTKQKEILIQTLKYTIQYLQIKKF